MDSIAPNENDKSMIMSDMIEKKAKELGYDIMMDASKNTYIYNSVYWKQVDLNDIKHFWTNTLMKLGENKYMAQNVRTIERVHDQCCYSLYRPISLSKSNEIKINCQNTTISIKDGIITEQPHKASEIGRAHV